jgi:sarcosine/dimethylglycine N-methyltransferase
VDLSEPFVDAARYLTERTGQSGQVTFQCASALDLPFDDGRFDAVFLQHVAMNIADRMRLYGEIRRVLNAGGRFATYDVVLLSGAPHYPVPWARTPDTSFLLSAPATRAATGIDPRAVQRPGATNHLVNHRSAAARVAVHRLVARRRRRV